MKNLTVIQKFSLLFLVTLILFGILSIGVLNYVVETNMVRHAQFALARSISLHIKTEFRKEELFLNGGSTSEKISIKMKHFMLDHNVDRVKVWSRDSVILWSDQSDLIGQAFPDNDELEEALAGEIVAEMKHPEKTEHVHETEYVKIIELYVPIQFDSINVDFVFEVYQDVGYLFDEIALTQKIIWSSIIVGFSIIYMIFFPLMWQTSKRLRQQTEQIVKSEQKYRSLFELGGDAVIISQLSGKIIETNQVCSQLLGYSHEELSVMNIFDLIDEKKRAEYQNKIKDIVANQPLIQEHRFSGKAGEILDVEISSHLIEHEEQKVLQSFIRDIRERKNAENTAKMYMRQQSLIATLGGEALSGTKPDDLISMATKYVLTGLDVDCCWVLRPHPVDNETFRMSVGAGFVCSKNELIHVQNSMAQYTLKEKTVVISDNIQTDPRFNTNSTLCHKMIGGISVPIYGRENNPYGVLCVCTGNPNRKFTEFDTFFVFSVANLLATAIARKQAENDSLMNERIASYHERQSRIGVIVAGVAHTMRNPVHGAINCLDILKRRLNGEDQDSQEIFEMVIEALDRIERITQRLLLFSRESVTEKSMINIVDNVEDVLASGLQKDATQKQILIHIESPEVPSVYLDPKYFKEILHHLLENAVEACLEGDKIHIRFALDLNKNLFTIFVEDTGKGISPEDLSKVTEPFYTTKSIADGSGLGLAIVQQIVEEQGGTLNIQSILGEGTTVIVVIPVSFDKN
ncbi:MAG: PAS domain S-box protein [SAR324 cluster bacterium]|nr:PAS domain S-box protein [SAR324 cluster bacterium]